MQAVPELEDYLRTARILHAAPLSGGGGHQHKQLIVLDGGLGVVAKLAEGPDEATRQDATRRVPAEVAAWILAHGLDWADLVPTTTLRVVRSIFTGDYVAASAQLTWPRFEVAAERSAGVNDCTEDDRWRIAIFDALAGNTDRNATNWGFIKDLPRAKLIDHGHAFAAANPTNSEFSIECRGQALPAEHLDRVRAFLLRAPDSLLRDMLDEATVAAILARAQTFADTGTLEF
jgi:hypothetical protein